LTGVSPDPLATLHRLRKLGADQARRDLAASLAAESQAEQRHRDAAIALKREAAAHPADVAHELANAFAAWRPRGLAELSGAAMACREATAHTVLSRAELATWRAAERAVQSIQDERSAARRVEVQRHEQVRLDDFKAGAKGSRGHSEGS